MSAETTPQPRRPKTPFVPPPFVIRAAWRLHRLIARRGPGRGLWGSDDPRGWGALKLTTTGRRSGQPRVAILGYLDDGDDVHALAMNGWMEGHPAWWTNLEADPRATITMADGTSRDIVAHRARGAERARLWNAWLAAEPGLAPLAAKRRTPTHVVVFARA